MAENGAEALGQIKKTQVADLTKIFCFGKAEGIQCSGATLEQVHSFQLCFTQLKKDLKVPVFFKCFF